jgi:predicted dithiol-disulfide oxidoreductase (DUF899 family)
MTDHQIVGHDDWIAARGRLREELSRERRELPWECVKKEYVFEGENGGETLADLFGGRSQLIVYHFRDEPDWDIGYTNCSSWADNFDGIIPDLNERDMSLVAASRAPLEKLQARAKRFGWTFKWVSCVGNDFSLDFNVWFALETLARGEAAYNYASKKVTAPSRPGISAFFKDAGQVFHTYSTYAPGLFDLPPHHGPGEWPAPAKTPSCCASR